MRERVFSFGPNSGLVGILTEPSAELRRADAPVFVTSNVGTHQRIGPFRVYVELARALAEHGYTTLRFDLSGFGDSAPRQGDLGELQRAEADLRDALTALTERRVGRSFVLVGSCSGVDSTHRIAVESSAVLGAVFVEGYVFRTPRFYLNRYGVRLLRARTWELYLERRLKPALRNLLSPSSRPETAELYNRAYPTQSELTRDYQTLCERQASMLFMFAGGIGSDQGYNYAEQFTDCFPELATKNNVELEYYPEADHVFTTLAARRAMVERICEWAVRRFTRTQPATSAHV